MRLETLRDGVQARPPLTGNRESDRTAVTGVLTLTVAMPEPSTLALMAIGAGLAALVARRRA